MSLRYFTANRRVAFDFVFTIKEYTQKGQKEASFRGRPSRYYSVL
ncbi:hypothetical protein ABH892_000574 [Paenibacillus sp. RC254]